MKEKIRLLRKEDFDKGFLETLRNLTVVGEVSRQKFNQRFREAMLNPDHYVYVAELDGKAVSTATLLVERVFTHQCGLVGHIENVATHKDYQGRGLGGAVMGRAVENAKTLGCYKIILDCADRLIPFYERFGFKKKENQMRMDL